MPTKKNIPTPELLYKHFEDYKQYCKDNPKQENFYNSKEGRQVSVDREIPLTWNGFEIYLRKNNIIGHLEDYRYNTDGRYDEYMGIIRAIDQEIYEDKFTGATAGVFQHNIIARDLGLSEKKEVAKTGKTTKLAWGKKTS